MKCNTSTKILKKNFLLVERFFSMKKKEKAVTGKNIVEHKPIQKGN